MDKCKIKSLIAGFTLVSLSASINAYAESETGGPRYLLDRQYSSEISAAETYLDMMQNKVTVIDVRRLREYASGHPERAYNVPYPHIVDSRDQSADTFYWEVYNIVKGRMDTPVATLCRTGYRSVLAANILADPQNDAGDPDRPVIVGGIPFTNVRNIWEGFVGQPKYAMTTTPDVAHDAEGNHIMLDLNKDGVVDPKADEADVYAHTTDANPDKDGWRNFQNLPWSTKILKPRAYLQDRKQYSCWQTDEGC